MTEVTITTRYHKSDYCVHIYDTIRKLLIACIPCYDLQEAREVRDYWKAQYT